MFSSRIVTGIPPYSFLSQPTSKDMKKVGPKAGGVEFMEEEKNRRY